MPYASVTVPLKLGTMGFKLSTMSLKKFAVVNHPACTAILLKNDDAANASATTTVRRANCHRSKIADRPS